MADTSIFKDLKVLWQLVYEAILDLWLKKDPSKETPENAASESQEAMAAGSEVSGVKTRPMAILIYLDLASVITIKAQLPGKRAIEREDYFEEYILTPHRQRLRDFLKRSHGHELRVEGNTYFGKFNQIAEAITCAVAVQISHAFDPIATPAGPLQVKISLYAVEALSDEMDYRDHPLRYISSLNGFAQAGQILLPATTAALVDEAHLADITLHRHSEVQLQGQQDHLPVPIFELLYTHRKPQSLRDALHPAQNLPPPPDQLIGRAELLTTLQAHLQAGQITLIHGPAGVGKTALALTVARTAGTFQDGIAWIDGESKPRLEEALRQILSVFLGDRMERESAKRCQERVSKYLKEHDALVVFDGFEKLATDANLIRWLQEISRSACLLITTTDLPADPLGEIVEIPSLLRDDAITLLIQRAKKQDSPDSKALERLCAMAGNLPLAIELFTPYCKKTSDLMEQFEAQHAMAWTKRPDLPEPTQRLLACFTLSYNRLSPAAQGLLLKTSILPEGVDASMIDTFLPGPDGLQAAEALVAAFLWKKNGARFVPHPVIRKFALDHLAEGRTEAATALLRLAKKKMDHTEPQTILPKVIVAALDWIEAEWRNIMAASEIAFATGAWAEVADLSYNLFYFWTIRGHWGDAERLYRQTLVCATGDQRAEARALHNIGIIYQAQGRWGDAENLAKQSLALQQEIHDRFGEGYALHQLASVYELQARWAEAEETHQTGLTLKREIGDRFGEGRTVGALGNICRLHGRWDEARLFYQQALAIKKETGDRLGVGQTFSDLGLVHEGQGQWPEAEAMYLQGLAIVKEFGNRFAEREILNNLSGIYRLQKRFKESETLYQQVQAIQRELGDRIGMGTNLNDLARTSQQKGKRMEADAAYRYSHFAERQLSNLHSEREFFGNMGDLHLQSGRSKEAELAYRQGLTLLGALGNRAGQARIHNKLGNLYQKLGRANEAKSEHQKSVALWRALGETDAAEAVSRNASL